ncbi:MAG TPA: hypothetical protein ENK25_02035 [Bacteroidetes bacterium]|nr:hypothetical protein [Bacteroidota bacterium]
MKHYYVLSRVFFFAMLLLIMNETSSPLGAQSKSELKDFFVQAESHFLYGEYELATPLYLILYESMPDNANIAYKIGVCYLNTPYEKDKAIPYLEKASRNASYDAKEDQFSESRAPLDVFFQLGNAYRINNQLDKAIEKYKYFKKQLSSENKMVNEDFVDQQILACKNAEKLMGNPLKIRKTNLGDTINISSVNLNPVISGDGNTLAFTAHFGEDMVVYYTKRIHGQWMVPVDITTEIGSEKDCSTSCLNYDGTELYLYKIDNFVGNIYISTFDGNQWSKIKKLNKNINTKFYESHASISKDGTTLYFTSNREGGFGKLDIYVSHREKGGDWGSAKNLGPVINTKYNENSPFISMNDSLLFFSSEGHFNMGGYDIFVSKRKGDRWKKPDNIGYPVSTTDEDFFFQPYRNGKSGYISLLNGYKKMNIFRLDFLGKAEESPLFDVMGIVRVNDSINPLLNSNVRIRIIDINSLDTTDIGVPAYNSGWYYFHIPAGTYRIDCNGKGILSFQDTLVITKEAPSLKIVRNINLAKDTSWTPEKQRVQRSDTTTSDTFKVVTNVMIKNPDYVDKQGRKVLYYTVQVMALLNPVDVSYFKNLQGVVILHGKDAFYRYTVGQFKTLKEAEKVKKRILKKGYLDVFVKKVYNDSEDKPAG